MRKIAPTIIILALANPAYAGIPLFNATCPGGIEVHADRGGPVYINGKEAKLKIFNDNAYDATGGGVTVNIGANPDGSLNVVYTGKHGANGICEVAANAPAPGRTHDHAAAAATPSFDCARASGQVEELICGDAELARLDRGLNDLYTVLMKHIPASEQKALQTEQRGWAKGRNDCWKADDVRDCVAASYRDRIAELKDR